MLPNRILVAQAVGKGEIFLRKVLKLNGEMFRKPHRLSCRLLLPSFLWNNLRCQISNILKELRDFVYFNVQYLNRNRNLDDDRYHYY